MHARLVDQLISSGLLSPQKAFIAKLEGASAFDPRWRAFMDTVSDTYDALDLERQARQADAVAALPRRVFPLPLVAWDHAGRVTEWNLAAARLFQHSAEQVAALSGVGALVAEDDHPRLRGVLARLFDGAEVGPVQLMARLASGERCPAEWTFSAALDDDGSPLGLAAFVESRAGTAGLPQRTAAQRALMERLGTVTGSADPTEASLMALMVLDLFHFARVNQVLGHQAGDQILDEVGKRLRHCAASRDLVARLGGDEFAILLTDVADREAAMARARTMLDCLEAPVVFDGHHLNLRACVGVAAVQDAGSDGAELLQAAQIAVQQARTSGPSTVHSFRPQMRTRVKRQGAMLESLQQALDHDELRLVFQPIVDVRDRRPVGFEALLRWTHEGEAISPGLFVPIAEEADLMRPISRWVLEEAIRNAGVWSSELGPHVYVSVNLSGRDLEEPDLVERIEAALGRHGVAFRQLAIEITETSILNRPGLPPVIQRLRECGIRVMLDDFGTGFSTLQNLVELQCDALKVDRSFVQLCTTGQTAFLEAVVHLARRTGKTIVAEGVEDDAVLRRLLLLGADCAQGWAIARPIEAAGVLPWLHGNHPSSAATG